MYRRPRQNLEEQNSNPSSPRPIAMLSTRNGITKAVIATNRSGSALPPSSRVSSLTSGVSLTSFPTIRTKRMSEYYSFKDTSSSLPCMIRLYTTTHSVRKLRSNNATAVKDVDVVDGSSKRRSSSSIGGDGSLPSCPITKHDRSTTISTRMDFTNPSSAHGTKSTIELLRAITVFYACRITFVVKYSETLFNLSTKEKTR